MEDSELRSAILAYLNDHHTVSLATVGEGRPHAATVFYINLDFNIFFLSSPSSRHCLNLAQEAQASATINEDYADWQAIKGLQLYGHVESRGSVLLNAHLVGAYVSKFPGVADFLLHPQKLGKGIARKVAGVNFYEFIPRQIDFINNAWGFGHREELKL